MRRQETRRRRNERKWMKDDGHNNVDLSMVIMKCRANQAPSSSINKVVLLIVSCELLLCFLIFTLLFVVPF